VYPPPWVLSVPPCPVLAPSSIGYNGIIKCDHFGVAHGEDGLGS
jgi:hypothetical protein